MHLGNAAKTHCPSAEDLEMDNTRATIPEETASDGEDEVELAMKAECLNEDALNPEATLDQDATFRLYSQVGQSIGGGGGLISPSQDIKLSAD